MRFSLLPVLCFVLAFACSADRVDPGLLAGIRTYMPPVDADDRQLAARFGVSRFELPLQSLVEAANLPSREVELGIPHRLQTGDRVKIRVTLPDGVPTTFVQAREDREYQVEVTSASALVFRDAEDGAALQIAASPASVGGQEVAADGSATLSLELQPVYPVEATIAGTQLSQMLADRFYFTHVLSDYRDAVFGRMVDPDVRIMPRIASRSDRRSVGPWPTRMSREKFKDLLHHVLATGGVDTLLLSRPPAEEALEVLDELSPYVDILRHGVVVRADALDLNTNHEDEQKRPMATVLVHGDLALVRASRYGMALSDPGRVSGGTIEVKPFGARGPTFRLFALPEGASFLLRRDGSFGCLKGLVAMPVPLGAELFCIKE